MKRNVVHIQIGKKRFRIERKQVQTLLVTMVGLAAVIVIIFFGARFIKSKIPQNNKAEYATNTDESKGKKGFKIKLGRKEEPPDEPDTSSKINGTVKNLSTPVEKEWLYETGHTEEDVVILTIEMVNAQNVKTYPATEPEYVISNENGEYFGFKGTSYKQGFKEEKSGELYDFISLVDPSGYSPYFYKVYAVKRSNNK